MVKQHILLDLGMAQIALYNALPFINSIKSIEPEKTIVHNLDFYNVIQITESHSEKGRTSIPGYWKANINYRFSPTLSLSQAERKVEKIFTKAGLNHSEFKKIDGVPAGKIIENNISKSIISKLNCKIQAKQAWTDIAQITGLGIPAFNFGPGLPEQAHQKTRVSLLKTSTSA